MFSYPTRLGYNPICAVVVVEGADITHPKETTIMIIFGLFFLISGIGALCWLLFNLAVYALPFFVGLTAGTAAYHGGAGVVGAITVGLLAATITLGIGQFIFAAVTSPLLRAIIALLFAAPAVVAGYYATLGLARIGVPSVIWRDVFAVIGAICVGCTAFVRIAALAPPGSSGRVDASGANY